MATSRLAHDAPERAALALRVALARARHDPQLIGEVEAAVAEFCREMRDRGNPPERVLRAAKEIIEDTLGTSYSAVAERAVQTCIRHYYATI